MITTTEIANTALGHLGTGVEIGNLATEQSAEARAMRRFYDSTLDELQGRYRWWWCMAFMQMQIVQVYPNAEFNFSYRYPSNCLNFIRFFNGSFVDDQQTLIRFVFSSDAAGRLILSNYGPSELLTGSNVPTTPVLPTVLSTIPVGQFTVQSPNPVLMPPVFKMAFSQILAGYAAPILPGIGSVDLRQQCLSMGEAKLMEAIAIDANEAKPDVELISSLQKSRSALGVIRRGSGWQPIPSAVFTP